VQDSGIKLNELAESQYCGGKVKSSSSGRREFRGKRRSDVRRSEHEIKRNAKTGLFAKPSSLKE